MTHSLAPSSYLRLRLTGVPRSREDELAVCLEAWRAEGSAEVLQFTQPDLVYEPQLREADPFSVDVFFSRPADESLLSAVRASFPECGIEIAAEEARDWMAEWKKGFKPFCFAGHHWIVPTWIEAPVEAKSILRIDPGMAFGTGTHETTALAAELILSAFSEARSRGDSIEEVADIGSGTGILALICEREGAKRIVANDIDPEARRTARENLEANSAQNIEVTDAGLEELPSGRFDFVVANIIDGVLVRLAQDLIRIARPGSEMVLSGILREREQSFLAGMRASGLGAEWSMVQRLDRAEWVAFRFRRVGQKR